MILENYVCSIILIVIGIYTIIKKKNLIKMVVGMVIIGFGINLLTLTIGFNPGGTAPIFTPLELNMDSYFVDPIPQVLTLALIVIGVCLIAVSLLLITRIYEEHGTIDTDRLGGN